MQVEGGGPTLGVVKLGWLLPPLLLTAAVGGASLVLWRPAWLSGAVLTVLVGAGFLWVIVGVFWPASADRTCPECGEEALERLDPSSTTGLRCSDCGHVDAEATGWFLAEEEGPLEELVLRQRGRRRGRATERGER